MSDKELSIEYSLNTPVFIDSNILTKKLFEMVKKNNITGGGFGLDSSNCIGMLVGIIIIIIGFVLLWFKNDLVEAEATIITKSCDNNQNNGSCKLNITYIVDSTQYSKIITIKGSNISDESTMKIYYSQSEPNSIQLYNPNYSIIGIGSIIVGSFIIIFSMYNGSGSSGTTTSFADTKTNLYSNSSNIDGLNVVYSK
jgi:ATP-dependent Zn protease